MQAIAARVQHWRQRRSDRRALLETLQWWTVEALREQKRKDKLKRKAAVAAGGVQRATVQEEVKQQLHTNLSRQRRQPAVELEHVQWWTLEALEEARKQDSASWWSYACSFIAGGSMLVCSSNACMW
jgi:hypothetical protein